ncbi:MAG: hypothetical protein LBM62_07875, partial [Mediterranea sp.]|nr:hypothetical protein [Mediterranea sp.]
VCGICHENADGNELRKSPSPPHEIALNREEALTLLSDDKLLKSYLCNKLFRRELFNGIRFPQGRTFEDVAVMHLLVARAQRVVVTPDCKYHYVIRKGSITDLRYKPVKEYDYFFSMYERACFFADAEQAPAAIGAFLKKAVRFADHLFLAANTSQHKAMLNEVLAKMHEFDSCRIQLSVGLRAKRMLLYYCLPLYRAGYRLTKGLLR